MLPEFRNSIHDKDYQGNQISGVVRTILQDRKGNMWFGTQSGLCRYDKSGLVYFGLKDYNDQNVTVFDLLEDKHGNVWIGYSGGIAKYDGTYFTMYRENEVLPDLWNMTIDRSELIWIGTTLGAFTFDGKALSPFEIPEGKIDSTLGVSTAKMIHSIIEDSTGKMWFATNGGVYIYDGKKLSNISEKDGLSSNFVSQIIERKDGSFWIKAKKGLFKYDVKKLKSITEHLLNVDEGIGCLLEDKNGTIWFTVNKRDVYSLKDDVVTKLDSKVGDFKLLPFEIYEDRQERLWFVGLKGAYRFDNGKFVNVNRNGPW
jgi:ligand-binding sensor domain-containing protein